MAGSGLVCGTEATGAAPLEACAPVLPPPLLPPPLLLAPPPLPPSWFWRTCKAWKIIFRGFMLPTTSFKSSSVSLWAVQWSELAANPDNTRTHTEEQAVAAHLASTSSSTVSNCWSRNALSNSPAPSVASQAPRLEPDEGPAVLFTCGGDCDAAGCAGVAARSPGASSPPMPMRCARRSCSNCAAMSTALAPPHDAAESATDDTSQPQKPGACDKRAACRTWDRHAEGEGGCMLAGCGTARALWEADYLRMSRRPRRPARRGRPRQRWPPSCRRQHRPRTAALRLGCRPARGLPARAPWHLPRVPGLLCPCRPAPGLPRCSPRPIRRTSWLGGLTVCGRCAPVRWRRRRPANAETAGSLAQLAFQLSPCGGGPTADAVTRCLSSAAPSLHPHGYEASLRAQRSVLYRPQWRSAKRARRENRKDMLLSAKKFTWRADSFRGRYAAADLLCRTDCRSDGGSTTNTEARRTAPESFRAARTVAGCRQPDQPPRPSGGRVTMARRGRA